MSKAIKLSDALIEDATNTGRALHRSTPRQIEYWARLGKIAEENPDLPMSFVKDMLIGIEDTDVSEYKFG